MEKRKIGMQKKRSQHVHKIELRIKTTLLGLSVDASTPSPLVCCLRCLSVPCPSWGSWLSLADWSLWWRGLLKAPSPSWSSGLLCFPLKL